MDVSEYLVMYVTLDMLLQFGLFTLCLKCCKT